MHYSSTFLVFIVFFTTSSMWCSGCNALWWTSGRFDAARWRSPGSSRPCSHPHSPSWLAAFTYRLVSMLHFSCSSESWKCWGRCYQGTRCNLRVDQGCVVVIRLLDALSSSQSLYFSEVLENPKRSFYSAVLLEILKQIKKAEQCYLGRLLCAVLSILLRFSYRKMQ